MKDGCFEKTNLGSDFGSSSANPNSLGPTSLKEGELVRSPIIVGVAEASLPVIPPA